MGGRGTLSSRDFKYLNKDSVFNALRDKRIILMRDGKQIKEARQISTKELGVLSKLASTLNEKGSMKHNVIEITSNNGKVMSSKKVKTKSGQSYRKLVVDKTHASKGVKHIDKLYKSKGGMTGVLTKTLASTPRKQQSKSNPRVKGNTINSGNSLYTELLKLRNGK